MSALLGTVNPAWMGKCSTYEVISLEGRFVKVREFLPPVACDSRVFDVEKPAADFFHHF
jgi:hypothetical protein